MEKVIIVGSGPAGHTAAIYTARAMLNPIMFEGYMAGGVTAGGQLTTTTDVENFPGFPDGIQGTELMNKMRQQSINCGTRIYTNTVTNVDLSKKPYTVYTDDGNSYQTQGLIIATGAIAKKLGIPGEKEFWQKGISACAVCDGGMPVFRNKELGVVGGGDAAVEEAIYLTKFASKVYLFVRRDQLRASKVLQDRLAQSDSIEVVWNSEVKEAKGDMILRSIVVYNNKKDEFYEMNISGLFYAIGHNPNIEFLGGQLETDEDGYIITTPGTTQTSVDGVFAAGDVQDKKYRQAITSAGSGCMAALELEHYLG
ncbi:thioredoxin-disulfide reductase [Candidatus Absconditicoccus praedator]|uniref:thioredoxin-disulfide reductase n=1 Tax=Candidatus Absconditicoccus praedator TaxID=2735562 RepID=UPI001E2D8F09|nr:thioredoxin-disulfide reductase [Candidatus Absconditicoccus praedator]UFX83348.1 thioredoxin-disulfide reductase [Candidatus Absconditicoccus praedator]